MPAGAQRGLRRRPSVSRARPQLAGLLLLILALACTTPVAPRTRVYAPLDPGLARTLYVTTNAQREAIVAELKLAGFRSIRDTSATPLVLVVRVGRVRSADSCGAIRNVSYELRQAGVVVAVIKGRGWIGSCTPNVLREMNAALAHLFDSRM
jgi:hypothetical protein